MTTNAKQTYVSPRVDILDHEDHVVMKAEMPGVPKDGAELRVKDGELTLIGKRKARGANGRVHVQERRAGDYMRVFTLSRAIDASKIDAEMKNGLLTVTLHKTDAHKPRQIEIK